MRIRLAHQTTYRFETEATYSVQRLKLTPVSFAGQKIIDWNLRVNGTLKTVSFRDGFGNLVHLVNQSGPHDSVTISVAGEVETTDMSGVVKGLMEQSPPRVFLRQTRQTQADEAIQALAAEVRGKDRLEALHDLSRLTRNALDYRTGSTSAHTTAAEALLEGSGVCQDHAHVFIAAARTLGIPSRYVTGYLVTENEADAHHAWAEAHVENLGWVGFDVANRLCPTENYVRLAAGLDADHAAPIRGSRRGGGTESLAVHVAVEQAQ